MAEITKVPLTDVKAASSANSNNATTHNTSHSGAASHAAHSAARPAAASTATGSKPAATSTASKSSATKSSSSQAKSSAKKPAAKKVSTSSASKSSASKSAPTKSITSKSASAKKAAPARSASKSSTAAKGASKKAGSFGSTKSAASKPSSTLRRVEASSSQAARDAIRAAGSETFKTAQKSNETTQKVVKMHAYSMKDIMAKNAEGSRQAQSRLFDYTRKGAAEFAKSAEKATGTVNEAIAHGRGTLEACIESTNVTADMTHSLTNEIFRYANEAFSNQVEYSKDMLACRTINDVFDLQSKIVRSGIDSLFNQSLRLSDMMFEYATEASEPLNQRVADVAKRYTATSNKR